MPRKQVPWTPEVVRKRIQATQLINRLQAHAIGEVEMSATQIRAAEILLRKAIPDLSSTEFKGIMEHRSIKQLSRDELLAIASGARDSGEGDSQPESPDVH